MLGNASLRAEQTSHSFGPGARMNGLKILVVDDHDIIRRGLKDLLSGKPGWEVCGEAKTGKEAIRLASELQPGVILMDISMPDLNGLEAARRIHKLLPKTGILFLTMRGYILKSDADRELVTAVESIAYGRAFFTSQASDLLLNGFSSSGSITHPELPARQRLTTREREIVQLIAEGKTSKEVAVALEISVKTAETHRANIMRKLEIHSISELVRYAINNRIIES
jgi:DNA-binding NarL/FixJ family response regulator